MSKMILASASPRRRELLHQIGMEFEVFPAVAEEVLPDKEKLTPREIVEILSAQKAREVFEKLPEEKRNSCIVIGADTVVAKDGMVMGKPKDRQDAVSMLTYLAGKSHEVYTGVTLIKGGGTREAKEPEAGKEKQPFCEVTFYEETEVVMYPVSPEEIEAYVDTKEPMDKAGAYGIQGKCAAFIREIHGDYNNVVGLPVGRLYQELKKLDR